MRNTTVGIFLLILMLGLISSTALAARPKEPPLTISRVLTDLNNFPCLMDVFGDNFGDGTPTVTLEGGRQALTFDAVTGSTGDVEKRRHHVDDVSHLSAQLASRSDPLYNNTFVLTLFYRRGVSHWLINGGAHTAHAIDPVAPAPTPLCAPAPASPAFSYASSPMA